MYFILITLGQSQGTRSGFCYFYMLIVYFMYWMRLFQLYFQRLSIANPKKAQQLVSKYLFGFNYLNQRSDSKDNLQLENNHLIKTKKYIN